MKSRCSGYSSDSERNLQQDLSILRKPISTALAGFLEAKRAYENGTDEIRRLLSRECDIIYECNFCRNMFRSLTNFISHKRVYCRNAYNKFSHNLNNSNKNGYIDHDVSTIIQAEEDFVNKSSNSSGSSSTNKDNSNKTDGPNKDLSSIVERLIRREEAKRVLKLTDFYDQVNNKLTQNEMLCEKHILQLDKVPNSEAAVYQTIKNNENDNIREEVNEVQQLIENDQNVLGPDGKIITEDAYRSNVNIIDDKSISENISCELCNKKFSTEKMLKLHIQATHITSTFVYQCPSCPKTFLQPNAVIRHLGNEHKKSTRRIRLMRESILKKRIKISEVQTKGPSKELARLQSNTENDLENTEGNNKLWMQEHRWSIFNDSSCTYCGKTFERKAVLTTHLMNCPLKMKNVGNIATRRSNDVRSSGKNESVKLNNGVDANDSESNIKTDRKFLNQSVLASIDLTKDDGPIISKRKRKKTLKNCKEERNDIESETLNEMFLKLGCSDSGMPLKASAVDNACRTNLYEESLEKSVGKCIEDQMKIESKDNSRENDCEDTMNISRNDKDLKLIQPQMSECIITRKPRNISQKNSVKLEKVKEEKTQLEKELTSNILSGKSTPKGNSKHLEKSNSANQAKFDSVKSKQDLIFYCKICKKKFDAISNLRRHISMFHYRSRKFGCRVCGEFRAFRKFDVINHLNAAHSLSGDREIVLQFVVVYDNKNKSYGVENNIAVVENDDDMSPTTSNNPGTSKEISSGSNKTQNISIDSSAFSTISTDFDISGKMSSTVSSEKSSTKLGNSLEEKSCISGASLEKTSASPRSKKKIRRQKLPKVTRAHIDKKFPLKLKFTRSSSNLSISSNDDSSSNTISRRPIRNRIKPVDKDFVYDLSHILKKDMVTESLPAKAQKRCNTLSCNSDVNRDDSSNNKSNGESQPIKGSAQKMAKLAVTTFKASYGQLSGNVQERSVFSLRNFPLANMSDDSSKDNHSAEELSKRKIIEPSRYRRMSDDSIVHVLSKRKKSDPTISQINTKISNRKKLTKDVSMNGTNESYSNEIEQFTVKCPTEKEFEEYLITNKLTERIKKAPTTSFVDSKLMALGSSTVTKRKTLLQRLAENQHKKLQESLLRSVLEN